MNVTTERHNEEFRKEQKDAEVELPVLSRSAETKYASRS